MAMDVKAYVETLAQEAGFDEDTKKAVLKAVENDKFAKRLGEDVMLRSDYSKNMDALRVAKEETEKLKASNLKWYEDNAPKLTQSERERVAAQARAKAYEELYGTLDGNSTPTGGGNGGAVQTPSGEWVSKKDFEAWQGQQWATLAGMWQDGLEVASDHLYRFGKPLDVRGVVAYANENKTTFREAYNAKVGPELEKLKVAEEEKRINAQVSERLQAELSKHNIPIDTGPKTLSPLKSAFGEKPPVTDAEREAAFTRIWSEAGTEAQKST